MSNEPPQDPGIPGFDTISDPDDAETPGGEEGSEARLDDPDREGHQAVPETP